MSPIEHYFENLLDMGSDIKGEPNKNALSKEVQEAIEICADYIKHNQFQGQYLTENCIACKYDETEEEDGEHCKKCLVGDNQFELDSDLKPNHFANDGKMKEPTTKNDLAVDCVSRADVNQVIEDYMDEQYHVLSDRTRERAFGAKVVMARINELPTVIPQEPIEKCTWIKYDYRTMCPKEHIDVDSPYWRIPENRMETLKYCPYCGKEIEVEE